MKINKEQMIDNVIRRYGFEVKETIDFCFLCETDNEKVIAEEYLRLIK